MCGIAGFYGEGNKSILKLMTTMLHHRGPDDEGFYIDGPVGLGHTRLSVIDLSPAGHQPMRNEEGSVWLVFNGEIYNFKDLKKILRQPHQFKSYTDTEVVIHLYEEIGEEVFNKLNGMFAIALYDKVKQKLILARDPMGKKPLYWGIFKNTLLFASELKALHMHPLFKSELDLLALNKYLTFEYVPTPLSIFKQIRKLEPGHYLSYNGQSVEKKQYWDISFSRVKSPQDEKSAVRNLDQVLDHAVKTRLVSDVPLGIFLSGGIDSSTVAYYAQKNSMQKVKTFSIGFAEASFDESKFARLAAQHLGTEHQEKTLSVNDSLQLIPRIANFLDEPMADPSIIPTYFLSQFTREQVTVALGGDGGDELFCGYDTFVAERFVNFYERLPRVIRENLIEKLAPKLSTSFSNISWDFKIKQFIKGFSEDSQYRHFNWLGAFNSAEREQLFLPEIWEELERDNVFNGVDDYIAKTAKVDAANQLIYLYLRTYLMDDILVKVDRASMFHSLEVRSPFLDKTVVDYVNSLPAGMKLKGNKTKHILKKLIQDKLPTEIPRRQKKGFGIPLAEWLVKDLRPLALELFNEEKIKRQGLFRSKYISKLLNDHFSRRADNRKKIWTLMIFELWQEKWLE